MPFEKRIVFRGDVFLGFLIIAIGAIFLLQNIFTDIHIWRFIGKLWPVVLIAIGLYILVHHSESRRFIPSSEENSRVIGDMRLDLAGKEIGDVSVSQFVGDLTIDLRGSLLKLGENRLNASQVVGDTTIIVPATFPLRLSAKTAIGDLRFDRRTEEGISPRIEHVDDDFDKAESKLIITFSGVVGDMTLQRV